MWYIVSTVFRLKPVVFLLCVCICKLSIGFAVLCSCSDGITMALTCILFCNAELVSPVTNKQSESLLLQELS